ncbi:MAG: low specificity L-threonine aldolase [Alphaproteobacteria bacterium]|nr:low specificity L-threonine aldolase [Alphaproteobacteria bacterium]
MNFASDNTAPMHPRVLEALARANDGAAMPYGNDPLAQAVEKKIAGIFERDCAVFLVSTGTAANALAIAACCPPWGAVYCHPEAHVDDDECGAPEFYTGGAKLVGVEGPHGKIAAKDLDAALDEAGKGVVHHVQPAVLSLTNATEAGTVYAPAETAALAAVARRHGLKVHVDGARFANALVGLGCTPAEASWKAGVDILSFGGTKNGCMAAEAIVVFDRMLAETLAFRRKRAGHLFSKMRFLAAQMDAYLEDGLWLDLARNANAAARRLAEGLSALPGASVVHPVEANEVFVDLPEPAIAATEKAGYRSYRWLGPGTQRLRLVSAWSSRMEDVEGFIRVARSGLA